MDIRREFWIKLCRQIPNKTTTYSGYKKTEVIQNLKKAILNKNIDRTLCLGVELHISGYINEIWKVIFSVLGKNISTLYPKLCIYFAKEYTYFLDNIKLLPEPFNNQEARNHVIELLSVICLCKKKFRVL